MGSCTTKPRTSSDEHIRNRPAAENRNPPNNIPDPRIPPMNNNIPRNPPQNAPSHLSNSPINQPVNRNPNFGLPSYNGYPPNPQLNNYPPNSYPNYPLNPHPNYPPNPHANYPQNPNNGREASRMLARPGPNPNNPPGHAFVPAQQRPPNNPPVKSKSIKVKEAKGIKRLFRIIDDSISLVRAKDQVFSVIFKYTAKFDTKITLHFFAHVIVDSKKKSHNFGYKKNYPKLSNCVSFPPTAEGVVEDAFEIDLSRTDINELEVRDKMTFPIIVEAITKEESENNVQVLMCCYKIVNGEHGLKPELIKQVMKVNKEYITLKNLFGTSSDQNDSDCLICLSEVRSVAVLPCRHVCYCEPCTEQVKKSNKYDCPVCRSVVESFISIKHD